MVSYNLKDVRGSNPVRWLIDNFSPIKKALTDPRRVSAAGLSMGFFVGLVVAKQESLPLTIGIAIAVLFEVTDVGVLEEMLLDTLRSILLESICFLPGVRSRIVVFFGSEEHQDGTLGEKISSSVVGKAIFCASSISSLSSALAATVLSSLFILLAGSLWFELAGMPLAGNLWVEITEIIVASILILVLNRLSSGEQLRACKNQGCSQRKAPKKEAAPKLRGGGLKDDVVQGKVGYCGREDLCSQMTSSGKTFSSGGEKTLSGDEVVSDKRTPSFKKCVIGAEDSWKDDLAPEDASSDGVPVKTDGISNPMDLALEIHLSGKVPKEGAQIGMMASLSADTAREEHNHEKLLEEFVGGGFVEGEI
jgi:hypothetical protein